MVTRLWQLLPSSNFGRSRLAATVVGCLAGLSCLLQVGNVSRSPSWNLAAFLSISLIMAVLVLSYVRRTACWWDSLTLPVLVTIGGAGLRDPLGSVALAISVGLVLSLYGPTWLWVVRTVGLVVAVPTAIAISPMSLGRHISWHSGPVLGMLPQLLLTAAMMRGIYLALRHQERVSARDAVLARSGSRMITITEVDEVHRLGIEAATEIIALAPGTVLAILRRCPHGLVMENLVGLPEQLRHRAVPESVLTQPGSFAGYRHWRTEAVSADLYLLVGGRKQVPGDVLAAFRTISNQVLLGETACRSHAELDHQAHHDHLTKLPTRGKFFRELRAAMTAGAPGSVALLLVDLDDFKAVNDTYGHAAGDELLVELATRIGPVGGTAGIAARLGGDEFAVLLTGVTGHADAAGLARALCAGIVAPARLSDATVSVGASIGIALTEPGVSADELARRADIAMYAAKASGKNRVQLFDPDRHRDRTPERLQHA